MEVMEIVRWDGVSHSLINPEEIWVAVATARSMRERTFTAITLGDRPEHYPAIPVRMGMPGQQPNQVFAVRLTAVRRRHHDPRTVCGSSFRTATCTPR